MPDEAPPPADVLTVPSPPPAWPAEPPTVPPPPGPPPSSADRPKRFRQFLIGAVVGGLCGALVASGAYFAFGRDDNSSSTPAPTSKTSQVSRQSSTISRNGDIAGNPATDRVATWHLTTRIVDTWLTQRRARPLFGRQPKLS